MKPVLLALCLFLPTIWTLKTQFEFGIATSALQTEGAWLEDGKTLTVWDNYAHSGLIRDNTTADVAADSYHRFKEDIALMKEYGIKHYRLSVQWARILPGAIPGSAINRKAVRHYRTLLQLLKQAGIIAYVNLYHNDLPAILSLNGSGKMDPDFPVQFAYYADVCFRELGDLVPFWFTFDEPWCQSVYEFIHPYEADVKPYKIGHNILLAHSEAVHLYRSKYKSQFGGQIGLNLFGEMAWPLNSKSEEDLIATKRNLAFQVDWFAEPLFSGEYPEEMKKIVGERLPKFTTEQKNRVRGSIDFFAINHYYSYLVTQGKRTRHNSYWADVNVSKSYKKEWKKTDMDWPIVPEGMHDLLFYVYNKWIKNTSLQIFITENGIAVKEPEITDSINDRERISFTSSYLQAIMRAREEGVPVTRYFAWSLLDNFEWGSGLAKRFGFVRVEYSNPPRRIPKSSLNWYSQLNPQKN